MGSMKDIMVKGMNKVMLSCEEASLVATQNDLDKVSCAKRLQLRMHLMGCKFCREFARQTKMINTEIDRMKEIDPAHLEVHLSPSQKKRLQEAIEQNNF